MMIAVITYGTVLFALMISQWRGETVSVSVSVKERGEKKEKNKTKQEFVLVCICAGRVCFVSLMWPDTQRKSVFASGNLDSSTFSSSHI